MSWLVPVAILLVAAVAAIVVAIARQQAIYAVVATPLCLIGAAVIAYESITSAPVDPPEPNPTASFRIVALGDSYISGEGAPRFFRGTDRPGSNECRRAPTAYAYLAKNELDADLIFVACSGARTKHVTGVDAMGAAVPGQEPDTPNGIFGARPQVVELMETKKPGAVLLSIGGNDAGFAEIGVGCASPGAPDCRRSADGWIERLDRDVYPALLRTYRVVRKAARGAPVFVLTYPNPLGPDWCDDVWLNPGEVEFVRDVFIAHLNALIKAAATEAGVRVIPLDDALDTRRFCEVELSQAAVNFVTLGRSRGSPIDIRYINSLIHGTFHPNTLGHELMAEHVTPRLQEARDGRLQPLPPEPGQELPPAPSVPDELRPPAAARPFPSQTRCTGDRIANVIPVSLPQGTMSLPLGGLKPRSVVCFRDDDEWRARQADSEGEVIVLVGTGSVSEILVQRPGGAWDELVVSRMQPAAQP